LAARAHRTAAFHLGDERLEQYDVIGCRATMSVLLSTIPDSPTEQGPQMAKSCVYPDNMKNVKFTG
jgi:hypothetical protein